MQRNILAALWVLLATARLWSWFPDVGIQREMPLLDRRLRKGKDAEKI